ncbi:MAG: hypothetical protein JXR62_06720 [Bacilli bacterium]|nr:hypothetical protein [Bacilli bacterium]
MIREFKGEQLKEILSLIIKMNKDNTLVRYFPKDKEGIIKRINKRVKQSDVLILVNEVDSKVVGYTELLVDESENYLQLLSHFSLIDYSASLKAFFQHFEENYKGYNLHYVLSDFNEEGIRFMNTTRAKNDGFEIMMHISKNRFKNRQSDNVVELTSKYYNQFVSMHNRQYKGAYWTGELLLEEGRFDIFVIVEDELLKGYVVTSHYGNEEEEIYFFYSKNQNEKISLYNKALAHRFDTASSIQVLLNQKENIDIPFLQEIGFSKKESIITFYIEGI